MDSDDGVGPVAEKRSGEGLVSCHGDGGGRWWLAEVKDLTSEEWNRDLILERERERQRKGGRNGDLILV